MNSVTNWHSVSKDLTEQIGFFRGIIEATIMHQDTFDKTVLIGSLEDTMAKYGDVNKLVNEIVQKHTSPDPRVAINN